MEEVKENVRYKVTGGSLNSNQLFGNATMQPTVGAGGQYTVNVQSQPEGKFSKLARGLSAFNTTLGALSERDVAMEGIAEQKVSEMSLEQAQQYAQKAKEDEGKLYDGGSFFDQLVRRGKAPANANPLFYSRGLRAYGAKVAGQEYSVRVSKALKEAQESYRANPNNSYVAKDIQSKIASEIKEEFGIDVGASSDMGFNEAASKLDTAQLIRDVEAQDKIGRTHSTVFMADDIAGAIIGSITQSPEAIRAALADVSSRHNNLSAADSSKALQVAFSKALDSNPIEAQKMINRMRSGEFSDVKFGGFSLSSTIFEGALDAAEQEGERIESQNIRDNDVKSGKIREETTNSLNAIDQLDFSTPQSLSDLIDVSGLPQDLQDSTFNTPEEMRSAMVQSMINKYPNDKVSVLSAANSFDKNEGNRRSTKRIQQISLANTYENKVKVSGKIRDKRILDNMISLDSPPSLSDEILRIGEEGNDERMLIANNGIDKDGNTVMIGDSPFLESDESLQVAYLRTHYSNMQNDQQKVLDEFSANQKANELKSTAKENDNLSSIDKVKVASTTRKTLIPVDRIDSFIDFKNKDSHNNYGWLLSRAVSRSDNDLISEKQIRHPVNRSLGINFIRENEKAKKRVINVDMPYVGTTTDFLNSDDKRKVDLGSSETLKRIGVTMDELRTTEKGRMVIDGNVSINVTDELLAQVPIRGASDEELQEAVEIINAGTDGRIEISQLRETMILDNKIRNFKLNK